MTRYYGFSLAMTVVMLCVWVYAAAVYQAPRATDGNGPDPQGLLIFLSVWPLGLLLLHSWVLAWCLRRRHAASILAGRYGLTIHAVLAAVFVGCMLLWFQ